MPTKRSSSSQKEERILCDKNNHSNSIIVNNPNCYYINYKLHIGAHYNGVNCDETVRDHNWKLNQKLGVNKNPTTHRTHRNVHT